MSFESALRAEIRRLRSRLESLEAIGGLGDRTRASGGATRRRRKNSSGLAAQRKLQGAYMGHVRRLSPAQKKQVSEIREKSGYRKAIAAAKKMAR
jgi:hypothetical protein